MVTLRKVRGLGKVKSGDRRVEGRSEGKKVEIRGVVSGWRLDGGWKVDGGWVEEAVGEWWIKE